MLSPSAEEQLCVLLTKLARLEKEVEIQRTILSEDYSFGPQAAFTRLDSLGLGWLIPKCLKDFLEPSRPDISERDLYLVIRQYSSESNGRLAFPDFMHLVLPGANPSLFHLASLRFSSSFTHASEFALRRLLEKEVDLQLQLETIKAALSKHSEFSAWKAFKTIDVEESGVIHRASLIQFAKKHGQYLFNEDIDAILRRVQTKEGDQIDYNDFLEFVLPVYSCYPQENEDKEAPKEEVKEENAEEDLKENAEEDLKENVEEDAEEGEPGTPEKQEDIASRKAESKQLFSGFDNLLIQQISNEQNIENFRVKLAFLKNFTVNQAYNMCLSEGNEVVFIADFEQFLDFLQVEYQREHIYYIFKRFGGLQDESPMMDLENFKGMMLPNEAEYSDKVLAREPEEFSALTISKLKDFFSALLKGEEELEEIKKKISCDYEALFKEIDEDSDGVISEEEMKRVLESAGLDVTNNELMWVFKRFVHEPSQSLDIKAFRDEVESKTY